MEKKAYIVDRALHWIAALLLLFMLMNLSTQLHNVDWDIKGQLEHRQDAVQVHATVGVVLLVFTLGRLIFPYLTRSEIPRIKPRSRGHSVFVKLTHIALYACIFLLCVTGAGLITHYEIPLSVIGISLEPDKEGFYEVFPDIHQVHMVLKQAIWWLIAIHFIGIMYARR